MEARAASPSSILVDVSPESPAPGENVNITLSSYANNLDTVPISWSVGGRTVSSGVGMKTFSLIAPAAGAESRVVATISLPDGNIQKVVLVRPTLMVLLWEATDSYVPPFYKGKALPTPDSQIKVVAIPEIRNGGQTVNPKNMAYSWKKNSTNDSTASGYGKNSYSYTNDYLEEMESVSVVATTTDQKYSAEGQITVSAYQPKILFYKHDESLGTLWERAIPNGYVIEGNEIIEAAPYFISPEDLRVPSLVWEWSINDVYVPVNEIRKTILPLKADPGASGTSLIKLLVTNKYKLFSEARGEVKLNF
jgi:hypothetical protein